MKRTCPDLVALSDDELRAFWKANRPEDLKYVGDRLLAESLPRHPVRGDSTLYPDLAAVRKSAGLSSEAVAKRLGVTRATVLSWERAHIQPPASLGLIYAGMSPAESKDK